MSQPVVSRPVRSAENWSEELALLFAQGSEKEASLRVERAQARARRDALSQAVATSRAELGEASGALAAAEAAVTEAQQRAVVNRADAVRAGAEQAGKSLKLAAGGAALAAFVLGVVVGSAGTALFLAAAAGGVVMFVRHQKLGRLQQEAEFASSEFEDAVKAKGAALAAGTSAREAATARVKAAQAALAAAESELAGTELAASAEVAPGVRAVVRGYLPFRVANLAGYPVVVDLAGASTGVEVAMPNLVHDLEALKSIRERLQRFADAPVLLRAAGSRRNEVGALYGEEEELRQTLEDWQATMQAIPVLRRSLPLVPRSSPVAAALGTATPRQDATPGRWMVDEPLVRATLDAISEFEACFARAREVGGDGEAALRDTYEGLRSVLLDYGERRTEALRVLQSNVHAVLAKSSLLSLHCYCPRCNRIPEYLYLKLGVPLEEAHLADQQGLLARLQEDAEIRARLEANPQLVTDLSNAWVAIGSLQDDAQALRARAESLPRGAAEQRLRAFASQQKAQLHEYQSCLRHVLLGSPRPVVELGRSSRLQLDPETGAWTCAACLSTWTDPDVVSMGRVLRVKDDLLLPLWNHLWTEKDDFRKSEIFRTNEQLMRLGEKESEKLLGIAESYKSDLRGVRERIISATAEAESNRQRLYSTLDGLVDMELMSAERADGVRARLKAEAGESSTALKRKAESNEMMLLAEPQLQLRRRAPAADPIQVFSNPASLFKNVPPLLTAPPQSTLEAAGTAGQLPAAQATLPAPAKGEG
ncbi:MAG: hypothetical protein RL653_40 [Pseudomonadota bacterium]|jgi:hypothetical protein